MNDLPTSTPPDPLNEALDRFLNPEWAWAFAHFMAASTLGPTRLCDWARAFLAAAPDKRAGRRYKLHPTTISKWSKLVFGDQLDDHCRELKALDQSGRPHYVVAYFSVGRQGSDSIDGSLIVVFERTTQTLVHHLVRVEVSAELIWFVLDKTRSDVRRKLAAARRPEHGATVALAQLNEQASSWIDVLSRDTDQKSLRLEISNALWNRSARWGRSVVSLASEQWTIKTPRHPLELRWLYDDDDSDVALNKLQRLLRKTSRRVNAHFASAPETRGKRRSRVRLAADRGDDFAVAHGPRTDVRPSWTSLSRTRSDKPRAAADGKEPLSMVARTSCS